MVYGGHVLIPGAPASFIVYRDVCRGLKVEA